MLARLLIAMSLAVALATLLAASTLALGACGVVPYAMQSPAPVAQRTPAEVGGSGAATAPTQSDKAGDVVLFALGLIETDYRFGGKNPEAGLDCSGMVSYVFEKSVDLRLAGSAADLARAIALSSPRKKRLSVVAVMYSEMDSQSATLAVKSSACSPRDSKKA